MNNIIDIGRVSVGNKIARSLWNVIWLFLFRPFGTKLFLKWRLLLLRLFGANVCWDSGVYCTTKIWAPWNLKLGHNSWLGPDVVCYNQAMVVLEDNVTVSQYAYICTAGHKTNFLNTHEKGLIIAPITFESGAWIGTRAFIGMGVIIGKNAIVGATASVYKDVDSMAIVGGNPATLIKYRIIE